MAIGSNGEGWPQDMVNEILLRLPVKSIFRFKCVATTWYNLFKNPTFISQHLRLTKSEIPLLVHYVDFLNSKEDVKIVVCLFDDQTLVPRLDLSSQLPHHVAAKHPLIRINNGLVCLFDLTIDEVTLWNPATSESRILPRLPPNLKTLYHLIGFGFDPMSNDYKVITVCEYSNSRVPTIYSMSTDSWRVTNEGDEDEVEVETLRDIKGCTMDACVNGVYYWHVITDFSSSREGDKLLAFDLSSETFQLIQLPPGDGNGKLLPYCNDGICFWREVRRNSTSSTSCYYGVWVLDEKEGHWTKLLRIEHVPKVISMFCFGGKRNFIVDSEDGLLVLDIDAKKYSRDVLVKPTSWLLQVCPYQESIVSIGRD